MTTSVGATRGENAVANTWQITLHKWDGESEDLALTLPLELQNQLLLNESSTFKVKRQGNKIRLIANSPRPEKRAKKRLALDNTSC